jgi:hypothetical protein
MPFTGKVGDTLKLSDDGGGHRYIVLTNPNKDGNVVIANFTAARYWKEWIVTFNPRDNKRIFTKKTTINYADARIIPVKSLIDYVAGNPGCDYAFCGVRHCNKIIAAASKSEFIPGEVMEEITKQSKDEDAELHDNV